MRLVAPLAFALALAASSVEAGVLDRIKETGTVRFGYREDAAPLSYLDEEKKPAGYSVLVCDAVAASLGRQLGTEVKVDWQPVTARTASTRWRRARSTSSAGRRRSRSTRRERVDFSLPTFVDGAAVMLPRDAEPEFDALAGKRIGVHAGTTHRGDPRQQPEGQGDAGRGGALRQPRRGAGGAGGGRDRRLLRRPVDPLRALLRQRPVGAAGGLGEHPDRGEARARHAARRQRLPAGGRPGGERALRLGEDGGVLQDRLPGGDAGGWRCRRSSCSGRTCPEPQWATFANVRAAARAACVFEPR